MPARTWVRIALSYGILVLVTAGLLAVVLGDRAERQAEASLTTRLTDQVQAIAYIAAPLLTNPSAPISATQALAVTLAQRFNTRVTFIQPAGRVIGDSESDPLTMENHAGRPEVIGALAQPGTPATVSRLSATVHQQLRYVALSVAAPDTGGPVVGIVRVAYPLTAVEQARRDFWTDLAGIVALISLPAAALAALLARSIVGPLSVLRATAQRLTAGDLDARAPAGEGEIGGLGHAFNTMTARMRQTIRERTGERNRLSAVLTHMHDGIILTNDAGVVTGLNPAAARLLVVATDQATGRTAIELSHSHELHTALHTTLATGISQRVELDLNTRRIAAVVTAVPDTAAGSPTGLLMLQDVTDLRRLERARRDFVANIGHELRTPLASIKLLVETLMTAVHDDPTAAAGFLQRIDVEVDGLTHLVRELLELSKIESGQIRLQVAPVAVPALLNRAAERLRAQAERAGLTLTVQADSSLPQVAADGARIEQVLVNLLHNAIKFTPRGSILLAATAEPHAIRIAVTDTGIGIPRDDLPRIFERFYKVDKARAGHRAGEGGTGLGLAIAKHLVQIHGGRIWAESPRSGGTTVGFTLPLTHEVGED